MDKDLIKPELEVPAIIDGPSVVDFLTEEGIKELEVKVELYKRYTIAAIKLTNSSHWINHGKADDPKYSLQAPGAEALCNPFLINWESPNVHKRTIKDDKGDYYEYEVEGIIQSHLLRRSIWITGNCSSRDQFFVARGNYEEGDIRKSAFSNWLVNGVTRLLGIRSPSPDMLTAAGLDPSKIAKIDYQKHKDKSSDLPEKSKAKREELGKWIFEACGNDVTKAGEKLIEFTKFGDFPGLKTLTQLSEKQIDIVHPKAKKFYDDYLKGLGVGQGRQPGSEE